jgi:hypothetical protein
VESACRIYRPRDPRKTALWGLLDTLYQRVKGSWEELFERKYGFWRGLADEAVARYLDCGGRSSHNRYYHCTTATPSRVKITRRHHPLQGRIFDVLHTGQRQLVVRALGGLAMRLPRAWTDADGPPAETSEPDAVFSVDAIRALLEIVEALHRRRGVDGASAAETCEGPEGGTPCPGKPVSTSGESASGHYGDDSRNERVER